MNMLTFFVCYFVCWNFPALSDSKPTNLLNNWSDQWFQQKLDHFTNATERWNQRYSFSAEHYDFNGVAFILIEAAVNNENEDDYILRFWIEEYCKYFHTFCVRLKHRYYGESHPTVDISTQNLRFLTIDQALADIEEFIVRSTSDFRFYELSKWVVFGMGYTGMLAALSRVNSPNHVHAVVASSSPLIVKVDFEDYYKKVEDIIKNHDTECADRLKDSNQIVNSLLETQSGVEILETKLNLCDRLSPNNLNDKSALFLRLASIWITIIQHHDDLSPEGLSIAKACWIMTNDAISNSIERYAVIVNQFNELNGIPCTSSNYSEDINHVQMTSWDADTSRTGFRQWFYQSCNEIGLFFTSSNEQEIFHNYLPVSMYINLCKNIFGQQFDLDRVTRGVLQTNSMLANLQANGDRMIFVQGTDDPWSVLAVDYINLEKNNVAVIIDGGTHCSDTFPPEPIDSSSLNEARLLIKQHLHRFLA